MRMSVLCALTGVLSGRGQCHVHGKLFRYGVEPQGAGRAVCRRCAEDTVASVINTLTSVYHIPSRVSNTLAGVPSTLSRACLTLARSSRTFSFS